MSFNENNIYFFKLFASSSNDMQNIISLYQFDLLTKIELSNKINQEKIYHTKFPFSFLVKFYFNQKFKIKQKYLDNKFSVDEYEAISKKYENQLQILKEKFIMKSPYSLFVYESFNSIISSVTKCQMFLHVQLHLVYYLLFLYDNEFANFHSQKIKIFHNHSCLHSQIVLSKPEKMSLVNCTLNFFTKHYKKHPLILEDINETCIEILIHIIALNYHYTKKIKSNCLFKKKGLLVIQTLIMLQNQNKNNEDYINVISRLLSKYAFHSPENILNLIKLLNVSVIGLDKSRTLMSKMFSPSLVCTPDLFKKIISNFVLALLNKEVKQIEILRMFLIEILTDVLTSHDSEDKYIYIFEVFYSEILKKFNIIIDNKLISFEFYKPKIEKIKISQKMIEFIELVIQNYSFYIKKIFPKIIYVYNSAFQKIFNVINCLNDNSSIYYNNLNNQIIEKNRKILLNFFSINFDFLDKDTIITKMMNYYLYPKINSTSLQLINITYSFDNHNIYIENKAIKTTIELINYYASEEYKEKTINSIENVFNIYPFNNIDILCHILKYLIVNEEYNDKNNIVILDDRTIISKDDEEEINNNMNTINDNLNEYKGKIIEVAFRGLEKMNQDDFDKIDKPNEILYVIMNEVVKQSNYAMLEVCLTCLKALIINKSAIFTYEDDISFINLLNSIKIDNNDININNTTPLIDEIKKLFIDHKSKSNQEEKNCNHNKNSMLEKDIKKLIEEIQQQTSKINICFSFKKLISYLSVPPSSNSYFNISFDFMSEIFEFIKPYIIKTQNDIFYSSIIIKLFVNLFLSIKSNADLRSFYLKLYQELLIETISNKILNDNSEISSKLFEVLVKIIKKLKQKTYLITLDVLKIMFVMFEEHANDLKSLTITSCISICAYLIEYSKNDLSNYYSTIILTALNYLKSSSSTIEEKRASAFLLYKILSKLDAEDLEAFSDKIFTSLKIVYENSKDNVLTYHLMQCLNFYE